MNRFVSRMRAPALTALAALFLWSGSPAWAAEEEDDPFYEGFYSGYVMYLMQANLSIGVTSDAAVKGLYEKETALAVVAQHGQWAAAVQKMLNKMVKDVEDDDAESIKRISKIAGLIKKQADTLAELLGGDKEQAKAFGEAREATTKALAELQKDMEEWFPEK